jgi:hypothetical protein
MKKMSYLAALAALTLATSAFAAGEGCCCCKDKADCCEKKAGCCDKKHDSAAPGHGDHADHGKPESRPQ